MLTRPTNIGKTFLLLPLNKIYKSFANPPSTSFVWIGAEKAEIIFHNDFRWSPQIIPWHDLLLMLEGQLVHLPAPKCHLTKDITFDKGIPIFATSKQPIVCVKNGSLDEQESDMMTVKWKTFILHCQILRAVIFDSDIFFLYSRPSVQFFLRKAIFGTLNHTLPHFTYISK